MINTPETDKDEIALAAAIGAKLCEARKLCNLSQTKAAELLGIIPENLKLIEDARFGVVPPILIKRASEALDVSADWILGLVKDDWEQAVETRRERDFLVGLERLHLENHAKVIVKQLEQDNKLNALSDAVALLSQTLQGIDDAVMQYWRLNQSFENMAGGAQILNRIDQAIAASRCATLSLVRAKALPIDALAALPQPKPVIRVWTNPATAQLPQPVVPIAESNPRAARQRKHTTLTPAALAS
ncbi:helix-turn-helix transcriptional regulator [Methylomonas montana]|uniref:helix-turn-helix domain-containing protein n=1 Tax=Methylomonas montana TaxID=3058963 RepID=UPI00265B47BB|nr:helix-turn-helix transcriptional regulator [Methylomonas montana]WKJ91348.1 helix-turn-helix transcriptional regulator [Methylomonas montana]